MENTDSNNFKKFSPPNDPIELEKATPNMMPTGGETIKAIEELRDSEKDTNLKNGYNFIIAKKKAEEAEDKAKLCHFNDFNAFLLGLGGYGNGTSNSTYKTPEFIQNFFKGSYKHNKEVQRYIRSLMTKKMNFQKKLVDLNREGPETLEECYIFWKYLIRRYATIDENDYLLLFNTNLDDDGNIEILKRLGEKTKPSPNEPVTFLKPNIPANTDETPFKYCNNGITFISGFDRHSCKVIDKIGIALDKIRNNRKDSFADIFQFVDDIGKIKFEGFENNEAAMLYYAEHLEGYEDYSEIINNQIKKKIDTLQTKNGTQEWKGVNEGKTAIDKLNAIIDSKQKANDPSSIEQKPGFSQTISKEELEKEINKHSSAEIAKKGLDNILLYILDNSIMSTKNTKGIAIMINKIREETKKDNYDDKSIDELTNEMKKTATLINESTNTNSEDLINQISKMYSKYVFQSESNVYIQSVGETYLNNRREQLRELNNINIALAKSKDEISQVLQLCVKNEDPNSQEELQRFIADKKSLTITTSIHALAKLKSKMSSSKLIISKEQEQNTAMYETLVQKITAYIGDLDASSENLNGVIANITASVDNVAQLLQDTEKSPQFKEYTERIQKFYAQYKINLRGALTPPGSPHHYIHTEERIPASNTYWRDRKEKDNWTQRFDDAEYDIFDLKNKYKDIAEAEEKNIGLSANEINIMVRTYRAYKKKTEQTTKDIGAFKEISQKFDGTYTNWTDFYDGLKENILTFDYDNLAEFVMSEDTIYRLSPESKVLLIYGPIKQNSYTFLTKSEVAKRNIKRIDEIIDQTGTVDVKAPIIADVFNALTPVKQMKLASRIFNMKELYNKKYAEEYAKIEEYDKIFTKQEISKTDVLQMTNTLAKMSLEIKDYPRMIELLTETTKDMKSINERSVVHKDILWMHRIAKNNESKGTIVLSGTLYEELKEAAENSEEKMKGVINGKIEVSENLVKSVTEKPQVAKYTIKNSEKENRSFSLATNLYNFRYRPPTLAGEKKGFVGNDYLTSAHDWAIQFLRDVKEKDIYIFSFTDKEESN